MQQINKISSRANILERIKEAGYETQHEQLLQLGYAKYSQNLTFTLGNKVSRVRTGNPS